MFTGIIEELGKVSKSQPKGDGKEITVQVSQKFMDGVKLGDSISVNGACQTATAVKKDSFTFFSSRQTLELTNLAFLKDGEEVNLEKALSLNGRLDGHIVSGHVDGMGIVTEVRQQQEGWLFSFSVPDHLLETVVKKGSLAVDGISLTIYDVQENRVTVSVIPLTHEKTILKNKKINGIVNLETDVLGKYVVNFLKKMNSSGPSKISLDFLKENGFL